MTYCKTIPGMEINHHVVYVFNKHRNVIDVLDSKDWPRKSKTETTRSEFHAADIKEIVSLYYFLFLFCFVFCSFLFVSLTILFQQARRFVLVLQAVYGKEVYKKSGQNNWTTVSNVPHYFDQDTLARQGVNECGVYALKFADTFDGDKCVEQILNYDVCFLKTTIQPRKLFTVCVIFLCF